MAAVTCLACGMTDPLPEQTCDGEEHGGTFGDHYVGRDAGCPACGRLMLACARRPCDARRADPGG